MENFTLYAKASGRCATWRTFPFDSGRSYSPRYYYTGNIGQKPDFTFWSRKPSRVFLGILFRYGGTKLIRKLFVYNSYTLFWQKIRFEIFGRLRGGTPRSYFQILVTKKKKKKLLPMASEWSNSARKSIKKSWPKIWPRSPWWPWWLFHEKAHNFGTGHKKALKCNGTFIITFSLRNFFSKAIFPVSNDRWSHLTHSHSWNFGFSRKKGNISVTGHERALKWNRTFIITFSRRSFPETQIFRCLMRGDHISPTHTLEMSDFFTKRPITLEPGTKRP